MSPLGPGVPSFLKGFASEQAAQRGQAALSSQIERHSKAAEKQVSQATFRIRAENVITPQPRLNPAQQKDPPS
jgi:hypothetical protein